MSIIVRAILSGLTFGLLWGGWAFFCNRDHGAGVAGAAFTTQFWFSFIATFFFGLTVDHLYENCGTHWGRVVFACVVPVGVMCGSLVLIHMWRGTPNILPTVLPSTGIAAAYCLVKLALGRQRSRGAVMSGHSDELVSMLVNKPMPERSSSCAASRPCTEFPSREIRR